MILYAEVPNFYAAVEQARDPELRGLSVVVGGDPRKRGLVQSASPEALAAGVLPGMSVQESLALCPAAKALKTDVKHYREVSGRLRGCLRAEIPALEPLALGSAYLDVSQALDDAGDAPEAIGRRLIGRVRETLGLPLQVGVARLKFLARLVAEEAGEGQVGRIQRGEEAGFLAPLSLGRLPEVGPKTVEALRELSAETVADLLSLEPGVVESALGNRGLRILEFARGHAQSPVRARGHSQSLSREQTFPSPQLDVGEMWESLQALAQVLADSLEGQGLCGRRVVLKVRYEDQETVTRSRVLVEPIASTSQIYETAVGLLDRTHAGARPVRLLGVSIGRLGPKPVDTQLELFR